MSDAKSKVYDYRPWQVPSLDKVAGNDNPTAPNLEELQALEEQSRAKGFEIGKWEGLEAGKAEVDQQAKRLVELFDNATKPLEQLDQEVAKQLTGLAMTIAQSLIRKELSVSPQAVLGVVEEALAALPPDLEKQQQALSILMHPDDVALLSELIADQPDKQNWQLVATADISRGGCQISGVDSFVDATLEKRSEALLGSLLDAYQSQADETLE